MKEKRSRKTFRLNLYPFTDGEAMARLTEEAARLRRQMEDYVRFGEGALA